MGLFVGRSEIRSAGNPFYEALNGLLDGNRFDDFAEEFCREFYSETRGSSERGAGRLLPGADGGVFGRVNSDWGIA